MKTIRLFIGAIALLMVFSCQKEELQYRNTEELPQGELITCSFEDNDSDSKTMKPSKGGNIWLGGDEIMLYDGGSNFQKLTLASSGDASSTTGVIKETDQKKFTFVKPSGWTNVYAIYPYSACVSEFSASAPKLNFAGQDGTFAKANISAAVEVSGNMTFKNVGAILHHVRKPAAVNATNIVVPVAELANDFQLSFTEGLPTLTPVNAEHSNSFDTNVSNNSIYIGVPAGCTIPKGSVFLYRTSAKAIINSYITGAANTTERNKIYTLPEITADGKLPGVFSVSADKKVRFSKGNLRAKKSGETWTWGFYDLQYEINSIPTTSGSRTATASDTEIDLFTWGYDGTYSTNPVTNSYSSSFTDWGTKIDSKWFTLSNSEWEYLLNEDNFSSKARVQTNRFAKAKINGINGLLIFPDGYNGTTAVSGVTGIAAVNSKTADFPGSSISTETWIAMESAGCVFLPAAGDRFYSPNIEGVGNNGFYWSSSIGDHTDCSWHVSFSSSGATAKTESEGALACSVRLVTAAN